jgi:hypothetical protein
MDTYADDLAALVEALDLTKAFTSVTRPVVGKWRAISGATARAASPRPS